MTSPAISAEDVLVRAQDTPNPYAIKFVTNQQLITSGKATFSVVEECQGRPLLESLFQLPSIKQVYLFDNTVTITHDGGYPIEDLKEQVKAILKTRLPVHDPNMAPTVEVTNLAPEKNLDDLPPEIREIEEILNRTVRLGLQADGGDIEIISFENNELKILYQGACGGCPSAMMGTLDAIQNILAHELDNPDIIVIPM